MYGRAKNGFLPRKEYITAMSVDTILKLKLIQATEFSVVCFYCQNSGDIVQCEYRKEKRKIMIYTLTLNPAVDLLSFQDKIFNIGKTNIAEEEKIIFGGKGINISRVLKNLDTESVVITLVAGFTGDALIEDLERSGIKNEYIKIEDGITRINLKIKTEVETEINGKGPEVKKADIDKIYNILEKIRDDDILVLTGSVPSGCDDNIYEEIIKSIRDKNKKTKVIVDARKDLLINTLKYNPFLIKPNKAELEEIFGKELKEKDDIIFSMRDLQKQGAVNVCVSLGKGGALFLDEEGNVYSKEALKGDVINTVGAGDSLLAGFIYKYLKTKEYREVFDFAVICASASAFCTGFPSKEMIVSVGGEL